jgi:DNA-binding Xre family transcriptional regulator
MPISTVFIFESLKAYLKARGMTYKQLADGINLSEPSIKRIFSGGDCSVDRLLEICQFLQIELSDLIKGTPKRHKLIESLTWKQEVEFSKNKKLLMMAICVMNMWRFDEMLSHLRLTKTECISLLARLEKNGFIELHPNHHYRLLVARHFAWIVDGPIMRLVKGMAEDYFNHRFDEQGEILRIINVRVSPKVRDLFKLRLEQVAQEFTDHVAAESHLPLDERPPLSICLASRIWVPEFLHELFRAPDEILVFPSPTDIQ